MIKDDWLDSLSIWFERAWHCWVRRRHHVKMGSDGDCYRCGRRVLG